MQLLTRARVGAAALVGTGVMLAGSAVAPVAASASVAPQHVTVAMRSTSITVIGGNTRHAGRTVFAVYAYGEEHDLQLLKLMPGVTLRTAVGDVNAMFNGSAAAVGRVAREVRWLGGVNAMPGHHGEFAETLYAGTYYLVDSANDNPVFTTLKVYGTPPNSAWIANNSTVSMVTGHRFSNVPSTLPRSGWSLVTNRSDEPHFMALQHVQSNVTAAMVQAALSSPNQPSWALPEGASTGILSSGTQQLLRWDLPAGKYLMMCWYPDDENGMPHAMMGMWKLVTVR